MKKIIVNFAFLVVILSMIFTCIGCEAISRFFDNSNVEVPPTAAPSPIDFEVSTDKLEYAYGEEITVELLFRTDLCTKETRDGNTYCVKILESPYYEIIGDSEVYTDGSENTEVIEGHYRWFWYRAFFTIKMKELDFDQSEGVNLAIKCVTDNWLLDFLTEEPRHYSGDPEYPFVAGIGFCPNSKSVIFYKYGTN